MELSEYLLKGHQHLYKTRTRDVATLDNRREKAVENRKNNRNKIAFMKRNIDVGMSPITPAPQPKPRRVENNNHTVDPDTQEMLQKLAKWKEQRKQQEELKKKKSRPAFKYYHVPDPVGLPSLELVNKQIKGKVFTTEHGLKHRSKSLQKDLHQITQNLSKMQTNNVKRANTTVGINKSSLRSSKLVTNESTTESLRQSRLKTTTVQNKTPKKTTKQSNLPEVPTKVKLPVKTPPNRNPAQKKTPSRQNTEKKSTTPLNECTNTPPVYVSPFVTVCRGKQNARAEFELRQGRGDRNLIGVVISEETLRNCSPQAGANYFEHRLNEEINRLEGMCARWEEIRESNKVPEDANDMIDVTIGQTRLLIGQKFEQFRDLINECRKNQGTEMPVKNEDLHGFWDMMYIQVDKLEARFQNLERIKENNWVEIMPEKKLVTKKTENRASKAKASSKLKEMIKARRKKMTEELSDGRNVRLDDAVCTSPSVTMMNLSRSIKRNNGLTPARSILKTNAGKTPKSVTKNVLFKDEDKENERIVPVTPRRSLRLVRKSLQQEL